MQIRIDDAKKIKVTHQCHSPINDDNRSTGLEVCYKTIDDRNAV